MHKVKLVALSHKQRDSKWRDLVIQYSMNILNRPFIYNASSLLLSFDFVFLFWVHWISLSSLYHTHQHCNCKQGHAKEQSLLFRRYVARSARIAGNAVISASTDTALRIIRPSRRISHSFVPVIYWFLLWISSTCIAQTEAGTYMEERPKMYLINLLCYSSTVTWEQLYVCSLDAAIRTGNINIF